jgi:adenylate cyclase class 2
MPAEIEAKFLNVDIEDIRQRLKQAGAELEHPMRLMRRDLFDHADGRYKAEGFTERLRIRDEGDRVAVNFKKAGTDSQYADEIETTVGSYDKAKQLLLAVGLKSVSYQETRRETWRLDTVEVVIDEWPWLKPYIEIEGPSEVEIQSAAERLGFSWQDAKFGSVDTAYAVEYPGLKGHDSVANIPVMKFEDPLPDYLRERQ